MPPGNADLIRPIYDEWGRGNWVPRFEIYDPRMEWGWSDEFPGLAGVYEDHDTDLERAMAHLGNAGVPVRDELEPLGDFPGHWVSDPAGNVLLVSQAGAEVSLIPPVEG